MKSYARIVQLGTANPYKESVSVGSIPTARTGGQAHIQRNSWVRAHSLATCLVGPLVKAVCGPVERGSRHWEVTSNHGATACHRYWPSAWMVQRNWS